MRRLEKYNELWRREIVHKTDTLPFRLAKLMIAVAWADGTIDTSEINALKDVLFSLPELDAREWAELEIYMDSPVDESERGILLEDVLASLRSTSEKNKVLQTIEALIAIDGNVSEEEKTVFNELKAAIESKQTGALGLFSQLTSGVLKKKREKEKEILLREEQLEDFIRNKVLYDFRRNYPELTRISDEQLKKLCSASVLLGRVAVIDDDFSRKERDTLVSLLISDWNLTEPEAVLLTEIVHRRVMEGVDYHYLTHSFFEQTTVEERKQFIKCLFKMANASEKTSYEEIEEIRTIANCLKISHSDFIDAKLTISDVDRNGL
ncbi:MAG: TerB family tellurite resistance protein [Planctomycetota bacterium]